MSVRKVHKPKKGEILQLPLGQQVEFGDAYKAIVYLGMLPSNETYVIGIRGRGIMDASDRGYGFGFGVNVPTDKSTLATSLDTLLEEKNKVIVHDVQPFYLTLELLK